MNGLLLFRRLGFAALGFALVVFFLGFFQINQGERGLVLRLGRPLAGTLEPGLHWGIPLGIDRLTRVRVDSLHTIDVGMVAEDENDASQTGRLITGDQNLIVARFALKYRPNPEAIWDYHLESSGRDRILKGEAESLLTLWSASKPVDLLLLEGRLTMARDLGAGLVASGMEKRLGIVLVEVTGAQVAPPREVQPSFDLVSRSESARYTLITRAQQDAQVQGQNSQSEAYRTVGLAKADATAIVQLAQKDAERFVLRLAILRENADRAGVMRQIWEEETGKILTRLKEQGRLGFLDQGLLGENAELSIAPLMPTRNQP